jgi:hypothetical protein
MFCRRIPSYFDSDYREKTLMQLYCWPVSLETFYYWNLSTAPRQYGIIVWYRIPLKLCIASLYRVLKQGKLLNSSIWVILSVLFVQSIRDLTTNVVDFINYKQSSIFRNYNCAIHYIRSTSPCSANMKLLKVKAKNLHRKLPEPPVWRAECSQSLVLYVNLNCLCTHICGGFKADVRNGSKIGY